MSAHRSTEHSLRPDRPELKRLAWAFGISVVIHLTAYGGYEASVRWFPGLTQRLRNLAAQLLPPPPPQTPRPEAEPPLIFVDINPEAATVEPPKDAKYYSSRNSQAANPDADEDIGVPKITGQQTQIVKAEDVPRANPDRLQPALSQPEPPAPPKPPAGDLSMAKPDVTLRPENNPPAERPRTLQEAMLRQPQRNQLVGEKMKQDGGTRRVRLQASFDAKATPFGAYDAAFIEAVQQHWYDLLDRNNHTLGQSGRVVLQFNLHYDGRISDMKVVEENVGSVLRLICQRAVGEPAPFAPWPRDMRRMIDKDYREVRFVFYYN